MNIIIEIKKGFEKLKKEIRKNDLADFINCRYEELALYHFGLGTYIRNKMLGEDTKLLHEFKKIGVANKDDLSYLLIRILYIYLKCVDEK